MTFIAVSTGRICKSLTVERPLGITIGITAFSKIYHSISVFTYKSDISIVPAALADIIDKEPTAVRAPFEAYITIGI